MCFTCEGVMTLERSGYAIEIQRVPDPYTQPTDFDLGAALLNAHSDGDWCYVGLRAVFHHATLDPLDSTVYGVPEYGTTGCALNNQSAIDCAESSLLAVVETTLRDQHTLAASPLPD